MLAGIFVLVLAAGAIAAGVGYVRAARFGRGGGFAPKFTYTYEIDGKSYAGDKLSYTTRGYKKSVVEQKLAAMPDDVDVHYNPANPGEAYLELEGSTRTGWLLIGLGDFLIMVGLVLILGS